jgi:hypothetical protein
VPFLTPLELRAFLDILTKGKYGGQMNQFFYPTDLTHTTPPANDVLNWQDPWQVLGYLSRRYAQWKTLSSSPWVHFVSPLPEMLAVERDKIQLLWRKMRDEGVQARSAP